MEINEISDLEDLTDQFGEIFPIYFLERNITRKIHKLIFNVPRFVNKHKTIGMLSEQEGESKHAAINAELRPCMYTQSCGTNTFGGGEGRTSFLHEQRFVEAKSSNV